MLSERFNDVKTPPSHKRWFGEGEALSFMFRCTAVYCVGKSDESIGIVPWVDVNTTSVSFWCHHNGSETR